eukprot:GHVO01049833.1.p1 GENE.GHVO01049833.1~~GHVO01049833.1.p1  ORF type:complete len:129 (-),score=2.98 GHVO01049833.1:130-516(-)
MTMGHFNLVFFLIAGVTIHITQSSEIVNDVNKLQRVGTNLVDAMNTLGQVLDDGKNLYQPTNCKELQNRGRKHSGVYAIYTDRSSDARPIQVYCDMETDGGGWLVSHCTMLMVCSAELSFLPGVSKET